MHLTIKQDTSSFGLSLLQEHNQLSITYSTPFNKHDINEIKLLADCYQMLHITLSNDIDTDILNTLFFKLKKCNHLISIHSDEELLISNPFLLDTSVINEKVGNQIAERSRLSSFCLKFAKQHYAKTNFNDAIVFYDIAVSLDINYVLSSLTIQDIPLLTDFATIYHNQNNHLAAMQCYAYILTLNPHQKNTRHHYKKESETFCKKEKAAFKNQDLKLISPHHFSEQPPLAIGGFSTVCIGFFDKEKVAIKKLNASSMKIKDWKKFKNELEIHRILIHPNIVKLIGICVLPDAYSLVQEYIEGNTLRNTLKANLTLNIIWVIINDISSALAYIHQSKIIHNDIKPENILLTLNYRAKITDFGIATQGHAHQNAGTFQFLAPELLHSSKERYKNICTEATDIYALGMVIWYMFHKVTPFSNFSSANEAIRYIAQGGQEEMHEDTPAAMKNIIKHCWEKNALLRPSALQVNQIAEQEYNTLLHTPDILLDTAGSCCNIS